MNVSRIEIKCLILSLVLLFPLFLSFLFPAFFGIQNSRLNDWFFKLRYSLAGRAPISPYLATYFLDDQVPPAVDSTGLWNAISHKLRNNRFNPRTKTILIYPGSNFSCKEMKAQGNTGKLFLPGMILSHPDAIHPDIINRIKDVAFIPKVHYHGYQGCPGNLDETTLSFPDAVIGISRGKDNIMGTGIANLFPDTDGVIRRLPLFHTSSEGLYYPSLFLAALCHYCDVKLNTIEISSRQIRLPRASFRMTTRDIVIPVDEKGRMRINYPGPRYDSFDLLSAARLLEKESVQIPFFPLSMESGKSESLHGEQQSEPGEGEPGSLLFSFPATLHLVGDISTWQGKFSTSIYDIVYPDVMILASAFNTVFTGSFIKPAGLIEYLFLYIPVLIFLNFFLIVSEKKTLSFFVIGMPVVSLLIPVLVICIQLFLFLFLHSLPGLLPLVIGILVALFLLLIFRLLREFTILREFKEAAETRDNKKPENDQSASPPILPIINKEYHIKIDKMEIDKKKNNKSRKEVLDMIKRFNLKGLFGEDIIKDALMELGIFDDQVNTSLYLLDGLSYIEIKQKLKRRTLSAAGQHIRKIYQKCKVGTREEFILLIIKLFIIKLIKKTNFPYPHGKKMPINKKQEDDEEIR